MLGTPFESPHLTFNQMGTLAPDPAPNPVFLLVMIPVRVRVGQSARL